MSDNHSSSLVRSRGRPRLSSADLTANQQLVLTAAEKLFEHCHSKQLSVEMLLQEAQVSRASFYRWFPKGMDEVLTRIIEKTIGQLIQVIMTAMQSHQDSETRLRACIQGYFGWAIAHRPVVAGLYREAFDAQTLVYQHRKQSVQAVIGLVQMHLQTIAESSSPLQSPLAIETMILWIESASMVLFRNQQFEATVVQRHCDLTVDLFTVMYQRLMNESSDLY